MIKKNFRWLSPFRKLRAYQYTNFKSSTFLMEISRLV